jgi:hypothetical protein
MGPIVLMIGLVVVRDWRGLGTKCYRWSLKGDFLGWNRRGGYERFRFWGGWCWIAFGALMICIGIVGLVSLAVS